MVCVCVYVCVCDYIIVVCCSCRQSFRRIFHCSFPSPLVCSALRRVWCKDPTVDRPDQTDQKRRRLNPCASRPASRTRQPSVVCRAVVVLFSSSPGKSTKLLLVKRHKPKNRAREPTGAKQEREEGRWTVIELESIGSLHGTRNGVRRADLPSRYRTREQKTGGRWCASKAHHALPLLIDATRSVWIDGSD